MLLYYLLIPCIMLLCGLFMYKFPPKKVNGLIGYRTRRSMQNEDTWTFANHLCGKLWIILGLGLMLPAAVVGILFANAERVCLIVTLAEIAVLPGSAVGVEVALHRTFDKSGRRREL